MVSLCEKYQHQGNLQEHVAFFCRPAAVNLAQCLICNTKRELQDPQKIQEQKQRKQKQATHHLEFQHNFERHQRT